MRLGQPGTIESAIHQEPHYGERFGLNPNTFGQESLETARNRRNEEPCLISRHKPEQSFTDLKKKVTNRVDSKCKVIESAILHAKEMLKS
jgi:hypothetical protein